MKPTRRNGDDALTGTLVQGIDLLACFHPGDAALGNGELARRTGLSPSTVARLTHTLVTLGYLRRAPGQRKYRPGLASLLLAHPLLANLRLRQLARPLMQQLAQQIRGAVSLVLHDRMNMIYVDTAGGNDHLLTYPEIGSALPLLNSAAGRAWLCQAEPDVRLRVLNQIRVGLPENYRRFAPLLADVQRHFERAGYCANNCLWREDAYGFAVPLSQPVDGHVFVFNCGVPAVDGPFSEREQEIVPLLQALARSVERLLGWH